MANEQFGGNTGAPVQAVLDGVHALYRNVRHLVIVTNEVFSDGTPADPAMQAYLQNLGNINCALGAEARRCGRMLCRSAGDLERRIVIS